MSKCSIWMEEFLKGKTLPCEDVRRAAFEAGFSRKELQVARVELRVIPGAITTWSLPEDDA